MPPPTDRATGRVDAVDVHQHLWPEELVDRLRARSAAPYLRGWRLHTDGEPAYDVDPAAHDPAARAEADRVDGIGTACLGLSSPLGLERLPGPEARRLLDAWHRGVRGLPDHFRAWASVPSRDADPAALSRLLADPRFVGLQLPATDLLTPAAWERAASLLEAAEKAGRPVMVHPGPVRRSAVDGPVPGWWAPVVDYSQQLLGAWWAWHAYAGRTHHPGLRVVFAAAAGLAPLQLERHQIRGGEPAALDPDLYLDSSGHGPRALDSVVRVLGIDALVLGSDRPYAAPAAGLGDLFGEAATRAVRVDNPRRLLGAGPSEPTSETTREGGAPWAYAS